MAGYNDTRNLIIEALMGRQAGTEIQPEKHQAYALNMLDYVRSVELVSSSTLVGLAEESTVPVQPDQGKVCYIAGVGQDRTVTFSNFIDDEGNPISITTGEMEGVFVILLWNMEHWAAYTFNTNIISSAESANFYYGYNIRKTYASVAAMNADSVNPIGTDGRLIKIGELVTVVNSTTPAENGYYSYEGSENGWLLQSGFSFEIVQTTGTDVNKTMSQKAVTDELVQLADEQNKKTDGAWAVNKDDWASVADAVIDVRIELDTTIKDITIENVRTDGEKILLTVRYSYWNGVTFLQTSYGLNLELGEDNINTAEWSWTHIKSIKVTYIKSRLKTAQNYTGVQVKDANIVSTPIPRIVQSIGNLRTTVKNDVILKVESLTSHLPETFVITRLRNSESEYFYVVAEIDGVQYTYGGSTKLYTGITPVPLSSFIIYVNADSVAGNNQPLAIEINPLEIQQSMGTVPDDLAQLTDDLAQLTDDLAQLVGELKLQPITFNSTESHVNKLIGIYQTNTNAVDAIRITRLKNSLTSVIATYCRIEVYVGDKMRGVDLEMKSTASGSLSTDIVEFDITFVHLGINYGYKFIFDFGNGEPFDVTYAESVNVNMLEVNIVGKVISPIELSDLNSEDVLPAGMLGSDTSDENFWLQGFYILIDGTIGPSSDYVVNITPIPLSKGVYIFRTEQQLDNSRAVVKNSSGAVTYVTGSWSTSKDNIFYIVVEEDNSTFQFSFLKHRSTNNLSLRKILSNVLPTKNETTVLENKVSGLMSATSIGSINKGDELLPDSLLNSTFDSTELWRNGFVVSGGSIIDSATFHAYIPGIVLKKGVYLFKTSIYGAAKIILYDEYGNVVQTIDETMAVSNNTYEIVSEKDGWFLRFCLLDSFGISNLSLKPVNNHVIPYINEREFNILKDKVIDDIIPPGTQLLPAEALEVGNETYWVDGFLNINGNINTGGSWKTYKYPIPLNKGLYYLRALQDGNAKHLLLRDGEIIKVIAGYQGNWVNPYYQIQIEQDGDALMFCTRGTVVPTHAVRLFNVSETIKYKEVKTVNSSSGSLSSLVSIGALTESSKLSIPYKVYNNSGAEDFSAIGLPDSKTVITLPISESHNVRFKFRITEDILNQNKNGIIFSCRGINVNASILPLYQQTTTYVDDSSESQTSYWPVLLGGIRLNGSGTHQHDNQIVGDFAFSIKYTGLLENEVTAQNTGSAFILKVNDVEVANYDYATYPTVEQLYEALRSTTDFALDYNELETRLSPELAIFPEVKLVSGYRSVTDGDYNTPNENGVVYRDAAPLHIPYSVCNRWHQVEIVTLGDSTYTTVNGAMVSTPGSPMSDDASELIFGGEIGVVFKDIEIDTMTSRDAEIVKFFNETQTQVVSEVNPMIIIWEGHGMHTIPSYQDATHAGDMDTTPDRLQLMFSKLQSKGYHPISLNDIRDYYYNGKQLPKRCYSIMFDDWRFDNYLDLKKRSAFTRYNVKPSLCTITNSSNPITFNGQSISAEKAIAIGKNAGFDNISHTRNHRSLIKFKPSDYENQWLQDVYSADTLGVQSNMLTYPFGDTNRYNINTLKWCGCSIAIAVVGSKRNTLISSPHYLTRLELGLRKPIEDILKNII